jgi:hypothetical protein
MAITVTTYPSVSPTIISASLPMLYTLRTDKFKAANVTNHRFKVTVSVGALYTVTKYAAVEYYDGATYGYAYIDISDIVKQALTLSILSHASAGSLFAITAPIAQKEDEQISIQFAAAEEYYLSGVFTSNTWVGNPLTHLCRRGWTDLSNNVWSYDSWQNVNGLSFFMPFSGMNPQVYPQKTADTSYPSTASEPWMNIKLTFRKKDGTTSGTFNNWIIRTAANYLDLVYFPIYKTGHTDTATFKQVEVEIWTGTTSGNPLTMVESYTIERTVETCADDEVLIAFRDRLFKWSYVSFTKKSWTTVAAEAQNAESENGRFRYNVEASDIITANTDWMQDEQNDLIKDLIASEQIYLIDSAGASERVNIIDSSIRLQNRRNEGLFQYQISFKKSLDNFSA